MSRVLCVRSLAFLAVAACLLTPPSMAQPLDLELELVVAGFEEPLALRHAGDGSGRLFVVERAGQIRLVLADGTLLETPFLDVSGTVGPISGELGLLGLAFHPDYKANGFFYVHLARSTPQLENLILRFSVSADPAVADPNSVLEILAVPQPFDNHNGGDLHFGPDGFLYASFGDGGDGGDPFENAQDLQTLLGTLIRLDVDSAMPYAVPADNPFVGDGSALDEIWAYGLRNPYRFSFDRFTGDLWIGDVGEDEIEEVDMQPSSSSGGENYGWDCLEGDQIFIPEPGSGDTQTVCSGPLTGPVLTYAHGTGACSVTGGHRYRGNLIGDFRGVYVYADFCSQQIFFARETTPGAFTATDWTGHSAEFISSFGEGEDGELYVVTLGGAVFRFASPSTVFTDGFERGSADAWSSSTF